MEVVDAKGNIGEDAGEMNCKNTITNHSPCSIPTTDISEVLTEGDDSQMIAEDTKQNKDISSAMENKLDGKPEGDNHNTRVCVDSTESGIETAVNNTEKIMTENQNSGTVQVDTTSGTPVEGGMPQLNGDNEANRVENLETAENLDKKVETIDVEMQNEIGKSSMNEDITAETVESLVTASTENENTETSTVTSLKDDFLVNGQHSKETTKLADDVLMNKETDYREQESSDSDSDSNSSSSSSSSSSDEEEQNISSPKRPNSVTEKGNNKFLFEDLKTEGEISLENLPPIEELSLDIEEGLEMVPVGTVSSVLGVLAIIQSAVGVPPLNDGTILFTEGPKVLGRVFEVFGPVSTPWYSVRFNTKADIEAKGIKTGMSVFYAPQKEDYTKYVFVSYLKSLKGSDASWKDDNEPPEKYMEYSDDEEERASKSKSRAKDRSKFKDEADGNEGDQLPGAKIRRTSVRGTGKPQKYWRDTEQHGQTDKMQNSWNNAGDNRRGAHTGYSNQPIRGTGPRYAGQTYSRGGGGTSQRFHFPRPRGQGPFGGPANFHSESPYTRKTGPGQFYESSNRIISPGRFGSPNTQRVQNPPVGNTNFGSNFTTGVNAWNNSESYKPFPLPAQIITDNRLVRNQDSQISNFSTPPPVHHSSYNQSSGFDMNQTRFPPPPPPQSTQHITFQPPPPSLNTNPNQINIPPPFLPSSNNTKNNTFIHNPSIPPPPLHPIPMGNQQYMRPPYPQQPPVFGGQPHFTQGPSGRQ